MSRWITVIAVIVVIGSSVGGYVYWQACQEQATVERLSDQARDAASHGDYQRAIDLDEQVDAIIPGRMRDDLATYQQKLTAVRPADVPQPLAAPLTPTMRAPSTAQQRTERTPQPGNSSAPPSYLGPDVSGLAHQMEADRRAQEQRQTVADQIRVLDTEIAADKDELANLDARQYDDPDHPQKREAVLDRMRSVQSQLDALASEREDLQRANQSF